MPENLSKTAARFPAEKVAAKTMTGNPMVDNPASWVLREKATGIVIIETWDKEKVDALNTEKYEAVPIHEYLSSLNSKVLSGPSM